MALAGAAMASPPATAADGARRVTFHPAADTNPAWSPDGSRIVFDSWRGPSYPNVWMIRPPGGPAGAESAVEPDESLARIPFDTASQITQGTVFDEAPAWSPDSQFIVFGSRGNVGLQATLWVMRSQWGGVMTQLTVTSSYPPDPTWSPDGSQIAFASSGDIWVIPATGGTATRLTTDPSYDGDPAWSPDGSQIAFHSQRGGTYGVWVIPSTGGTANQIVSSGESPAWSPDGSRIAFDSGGEIWVIPAGGGIATQLTSDPSSAVSDPAWSPDGSQVAFGSRRSGNLDIWVIDVDGAREPLSLERESWGSIKAGYRE